MPDREAQDKSRAENRCLPCGFFVRQKQESAVLILLLVPFVLVALVLLLVALVLVSVVLIALVLVVLAVVLHKDTSFRGQCVQEIFCPGRDKSMHKNF